MASFFVSRVDTKVDAALVAIGSGGATYSQAVKAQLKKHLGNVLLLDTFGGSEGGNQGQGVEATGGQAGPRFRADETSAVLDENMKPLPPGTGTAARRSHGCSSIPPQGMPFSAGAAVRASLSSHMKKSSCLPPVLAGCTATSEGSARVSSIEFVWRLCVPPITPASASSAVRTMLL